MHKDHLYQNLQKSLLKMHILRAYPTYWIRICVGWTEEYSFFRKFSQMVSMYDKVEKPFFTMPDCKSNELKQFTSLGLFLMILCFPRESWRGEIEETDGDLEL